MKPLLRLLVFLLPAALLTAQSAPKITTPKEALGFNLGDDYMMASYAQLETYWKKIATECDRCKLVDIGPTEEGRHQYMMIISSPANMKKLEHYREINARLAHAEGLTDDQAHALAREGKAVVWIDGGLHASETVGAQQLMEQVYEMASRTDPETMRLLDETIALYTQVNPDGQDIVANWYMREQDPLKRSLNGIPRLWAKYIGHDDNRDFYMSAMKETTNINKVLWTEWFPQILYNHHQTGPVGGVIFMPPFRDPFNFNFDPLIPLGIEMVGTAMHTRLVQQGLGGSEMRSGANYSTWWNGGLRTIAYFHNSIGLLTEIIGSPTPLDVPLVPEKQLPSGDWPLPITPTTGTQKWHYRQSIEYEMSNNRAVLDVAARYREVWLYNTYQMARNSIKKGSEDTWTITPKRIEALEAAAAKLAPSGGRGGRSGGGRGGAGAEAELPTGLTVGGLGARTVPADLYNTVLHDPKLRDPRGYIIPSDQPDFATATEFIDALLKNGVDVMRATSSFSVAGKNYPTGSYVVKTAQAFRAHVMDMFEPQDHPNDFTYPGGPPKPPYDIAGWTLAFQMGVKFDRILDAFDGPFTKINGILPPPPSSITGTGSAGWLVSHQINNSFILTNRLLKAGVDVYWLKQNAEGPGTIWIPSNPSARPILEQAARQLGVPVQSVASAPKGEAMKLNPIRVGLFDQYGGLMPSGWIRWLFENYEVPFQVVYPQTLDAGDLKSKFDVLVFSDGAYRAPGSGGRGGGFFNQAPPEDLPAEYQGWTGRITPDKTLPQLKKFVESGGSIVTIGSSTGLAELLGLPVKNYLTEMGPDGRERPLPGTKFYIPGSLMRAQIDNTNPIAYGMPSTVDVFYDNSPVFKMGPDAEQKKTSAVAWFSGPQTLDSGWAWGQQYLDGGTAAAEATVGEGKVVLLGPEVTFRSQPHATYKLLFNGLYFGTAKDATLQ
jgi:hypothetical protein